MAASPKKRPASPGRAEPAGPRKPTRSERLAAAAAARRRKQVRTRAAIAGGVVLALALVAAVVISDRREKSRLIAALEEGGCTFDTRSDPNSDPPLNHVPAPVYEVDPPAGGDHLATPAPAGRYTVEDAPPDGQLVHSLEHGYIVLWHHPDADEATMTAIGGIYDRHARDVLVVPRASMATPVAATAWGERLLCGSVDASALERFVTAYANKGPEKVAH